MRTLLLVLLTFVLTGCYTSFHVVEDRPQRTVITTSTPTTYYYNSYPYTRYWVNDRYVYYPRYYIYNKPTVVKNTIIKNRRTVQTRKSIRSQPRSSGLSKGTTSRTPRVQRRTTEQRVKSTRPTRSRTEVSRRSTTNQRVRSTQPTRTRSEVKRSSSSRSERSSNRRSRNDN